jgi:hypothetical protein
MRASHLWLVRGRRRTLDAYPQRIDVRALGI